MTPFGYRVLGFGSGGAGAPEYIAATGPDDAAGVTDGNYKYHIFNATKTGANGFSVSAVGNEAGSNTVEYLVIAGAMEAVAVQVVIEILAPKIHTQEIPLL